VHKLTTVEIKLISPLLVNCATSNRGFICVLTNSILFCTSDSSPTTIKRPLICLRVEVKMSGDCILTDFNLYIS